MPAPGRPAPAFQRRRRADCLVFYGHGYGNHTHYEAITHRVQSWTTAEVMILSEHWT